MLKSSKIAYISCMWYIIWPFRLLISAYWLHFTCSIFWVFFLCFGYGFYGPFKNSLLTVKKRWAKTELTNSSLTLK